MKTTAPHYRSISGLQLQHCHRLVFFLLGLYPLLFISSCGPREDAKPSEQKAGLELNLDEIKSRYQDAHYYSDRAKLVLQYTLNGTPYEEVHPCASQLVRNQSQRVHRFKLEVTGNSNVTIARVLDAQSQNLDGQVLCLEHNPAEFWNLLETDSIAQHFAFGIDDIPWNETLDNDEKTRFLGIASNLFNGLDPGWFDEENLVETKRVEVTGIQFADTVFKTAYGKAECRIDFHEKTIVGIRLPMGLLSGKISSSPDVSGVSLAILFQGISFDQRDAAEVKIGPNENPISKFVKLPEQFPSKAIGSKVEGWNIIDRNEQPFDPAAAIGATGLYFYGDPSQITKADLGQIETLSKEKPFANFAWFLPPAIPFDRGLKFSRMGLFLDQKGEMLENVAADSTRFYLIVNQSGVIQFVCQQKKGWLKDIGPILDRVRQGDNVAQEMHQEYSSYFEKYQGALMKNGVDKSVLDSLGNPK